MIPKYIATLSAAVFLATALTSSLGFVTRSHVLSGTAVDETWKFSFTIDSDRDHSYEISPEIARFLEERIGFHTEGPARVIAAKTEVTPGDVTWHSGHTSITSTGATMTVRLRWETAEDSAGGARGSIFLDFPAIPGLGGIPPSFHSGGYQIDESGRYVVREVTAYRSPLQLFAGRFFFALSAGLPLGIFFHTIWWALVVVNPEKRSRQAQLPQANGFPRTFYPDPVAEWAAWLMVLAIGAFVASIMAGASGLEGFMSSSFMQVPYDILAGAAILGALCAYYTARSVLTFRIESAGISWARGRGNLRWLNCPWSGISLFREKSRTSRGSTTRWIEIEFTNGLRKLRIGQSIEGYATLRDILMNVFAPAGQG
jgi:hypothetical protein